MPPTATLGKMELLNEVCAIDLEKMQLEDFHAATEIFAIRHAPLMNSDRMVIWQPGINADGICARGDKGCEDGLSLVLDKTDAAKGEFTWQLTKSSIFGRASDPTATMPDREAFVVTVAENGVNARYLLWEPNGTQKGEQAVDTKEALAVIELIWDMLAHPDFTKEVADKHRALREAEAEVARMKREGKGELAQALYEERLETASYNARKIGFSKYTGAMSSAPRPKLTPEQIQQMLQADAKRRGVAYTALQGLIEPEPIAA